jgi:RHS repeat-associated protein
MRDPGNDAFLGAVNSLAARDAYGYSLHYFEGDYEQIGMQGNAFIANQSGSDLAHADLSKDLYNGNIKRMITTITDPNTRDVLPLGNAYRYDQLNRLMSAHSTENIDMNDNEWDSGSGYVYKNTFAYDANGNITRQLRRNGANAPVDSLTYRYHDNSNGKRLRNRLYHVEDSVGNGTFGDDVDDMGTFTGGSTINTANNYSYDPEGRLVQDAQEKLDTILWRVDGKVAFIEMETGFNKKNLRFDYDAMGHRIAKHVYTDADVLEYSTYYVLDAQGNVLSVYEHAVDELEESTTFYQAEKYIYGSSRLGVLNDSIPLLGTENDTYDMTLTDHIIGKRTYELTNHLGNVLSTVSDKVIPVERENDPLVDQDFSSSYIPFSTWLISSAYLDAGRYHLDSCSMWGSASFILPTEPGATYTISYDIDLDGGGNVRAYTHDPGTAMNLTDELSTTNGSYSYTVTAEGTTTLFNWSNEDPGSPRDFYLDNVTITRDLGEEALYFLADIRSSQDYSPFGVTLDGRNFVLAGAEKSRYGFQSQERDDEIKGEGNSYNYTYRMHDPRLGRFFAIDPLVFDYPELTPYQFSSNRLIDFREIEGMEGSRTDAWFAGWEDAMYSNLLQAGFGREDADDLYPDDLYAQRSFLMGQMAGDVASMAAAGIEITMGWNTLALSGTLAANVEGTVITEGAALVTAIAGLVELGVGAMTAINASKGFKKSYDAYGKISSKIQKQEEAAKNMIGAKGTKTASKTVWKSKGSKARIDVENPAPGKRPGQLHYQDKNNTKYMYDFEKGVFYGKNKKTGKYDVEAPSSVKDLLKDSEFKKGIEKGKKILGE